MQESTRSTKKAKKNFTQRDFPYALKSFLGYLEGSKKAQQTIKNYRLDLMSYHKFLDSRLNKYSNRDLGKTEPRAENIGAWHLEDFHNYLKASKLKNNTRRRILLTVQKFFNYLQKRNKISSLGATRYPTPLKVERVPKIVSWDELHDAVQALPENRILEKRNKLLLNLLLETGVIVSEVPQIKFSCFRKVQAAAEEKYYLDVPGKATRIIPVSRVLFERVRKFQIEWDHFLKLGMKGVRDFTPGIENDSSNSAEAITRRDGAFSIDAADSANETKNLFYGFNKFGSLGLPISQRGVELVVKEYAHRMGFLELTPRIIRHSTVLYWLKKNLTKSEVKQRLGLKTFYAFRTFQPLFNNILNKETS